MKRVPRSLATAAFAAALALLLLAAPLARASDSRAGAERLFYGYPIEQDIGAFGQEASEPGTGANKISPCTGNLEPETMIRTAWYRLVGTGGKIDISTAGSQNGFVELDTIMALYELGQSTPLKCSDNVSGSDDTSRISGYGTTAGKVYEVQVGTPSEGFVNCIAPCELHLSATNEQSPPGDQRAAPLPLTSTTPGDNSFASEEPGEVLSCAGAKRGTYAKTIWFAYHAPDYGQATFETEGIDTVAAVYAGGSATPIACNDDVNYVEHETNSRVSADVTPGEEILVQVGGYSEGVNQTRGTFATSVSFVLDEDVDGDGVKAARFGGADCNDFDANVNPGAREIRGNAVDENCDGVAAPYLRIDAKVSAHFEVRQGFTRVTRLVVSGAPKGSRVKLACKKKVTGCPFSSKSLSLKSARRLSLTGTLKRAELKPGAILQLRVTAPESIGAYTSFKIRAGKKPLKKSLCLPPGAKSPVACA